MSFKENLKNHDWKRSLKKNGTNLLVFGVGMLGVFTVLDIINGFNQKPKAQQALPEGKTK